MKQQGIHAKRDRSLDILRGIGSVLMVIAHARTLGKVEDSYFAVLAWKLSLFAPVLFFYAAGRSSRFQSKKYPLSMRLLFALSIFLLSAIDILKNANSFFDVFLRNLFGSLAISSILVQSLLFLVDFPLTFVFPVLIAKTFSTFFGETKNMFFGDLFSLFPWITFTFLGAFYKKERISLFRFIGLCGFCAALVLYFFKSRTIENQDATMLYVASGYVLIFIAEYAASSIQKSAKITDFLQYLGRYSFPFYWLHIYIVSCIPIQTTAWVVWVVVLTTSVAALFVAQKAVDRIGNRWFGLCMLCIGFLSIWYFAGVLPLGTVDFGRTVLLVYLSFSYTHLCKDLFDWMQFLFPKPR